MSGVRWTDEEVRQLRAAYERAQAGEQIGLDELADRLGRHKTNVCRKARELGLTDQGRPKRSERKPPRARKFASQEERSAATSARVKAMFAERGHPRGALGLKHTPETKQKMSAASKAAWADPANPLNSPEMAQARSDRILARIAAGQMRSGHTRTRGGRRADLGGRYFRSAWEANYARYLNFLMARGEIASWDYECKTFVFEAIKRGTRAYTPDFRVDLPGGGHEWHEVKGWMDGPSKTRLARMARYYPGEKVVVIGADWFRAVNKGALPGVISGWEGGTTR